MTRRYTLGIDLGSSSVKACLFSLDSGKEVASASSPDLEMPISSVSPGFAEQSPDLWWQHTKNAVAKIRSKFKVEADSVEAIGIAYQMHGLVLVDKQAKPLRDSIIWCDSRAVDIGNRAFKSLGEEYCLANYLNSPGNFTASKLAWVLQNEPAIAKQIYKFLLPGDYLALKLTGEFFTSRSGISEGILWNFKQRSIASDVLEHYAIPSDYIPDVAESFQDTGYLTSESAKELGLDTKTKVSYRAGDQPNNAFSLRVLDPGQVATTAGTSAVIYGILDNPTFDQQSRVNTFLHVNDTAQQTRLGVLACINGAGILNSWVRRMVSFDSQEPKSYARLNDAARTVAPGAEGLCFIPYGNGSERTLANRKLSASMEGIEFNTHSSAHIFRAAQEAVVFAMKYGLDIAKNMGVQSKIVRTGQSNMFLSHLFAEVFAAVTESTVEFYNTDGAQGAARGAAVGSGVFSIDQCFEGLSKVASINAEVALVERYKEIYGNWCRKLEKKI